MIKVREDRLAKEIGVARQVLVDLRKEHLKKGEDWEKEGNCIVLTSRGIRRVQDQLGVKVELLSSMEVSAGMTVQYGEFEEMDVIRSGMINPRVVQCRRENGEEVYVRVNDSRNFKPIGNDGRPMKLKARYTKDGWYMEGRCPRYPGRW